MTFGHDPNPMHCGICALLPQLISDVIAGSLREIWTDLPFSTRVPILFFWVVCPVTRCRFPILTKHFTPPPLHSTAVLDLHTHAGIYSRIENLGGPKYAPSFYNDILKHENLFAGIPGPLRASFMPEIQHAENVDRQPLFPCSLIITSKTTRFDVPTGVHLSRHLVFLATSIS